VPWRKCLVRSLVFAVLAGIGAAVWTYLHWTDPVVVRRHVIAQLEAHFPGATVHVDTARLRLLGGISLTELRLVRRDDPEQDDFLHVPEAIIYHDKEQVLDGTLAIRRIELRKPRLRIVRDRYGRWNVSGLLGPTQPEEPLPTIVIEHGTVLIEDRLGAPDLMPLELKDVSLTMVNDPLPTLDFAVHGSSDVLGPLRMSASWERTTGALATSLEVGDTSFGAALLQRISAYYPEAARHLEKLEGNLRAQVALQHRPGSAQPWCHHIRCQLSGGKLTHPLLPLVLADVEAHVHCDDGRTTLESFTARSGNTQFQLDGSAETPTRDSDLAGTLTIKKLNLTPELLKRLPDPLPEVQHDYDPTGLIDLSVSFARRDGQWQRNSVVLARDASMRSIFFPYRVEHVRGTIENDVDPTRQRNVKHFELVGDAAGQPVHVKGEASGVMPHIGINVDISGDNLPLDNQVRAALPEKCQKLADAFHPTGRADFVARIRRTPDAARCANHITVHFHEAALSYDVFPYPLEEVSGTLDILPEHWEFRDFRGRHKGGEFLVWGRSHPTPAGDEVAVEIRGSNLVLDDELREALTPRGKTDSKLKAAWTMLHPGGRMNVAASIDRLPEQPEDVDVSVTAHGCTLRPDFFPYPMEDVSGTVHYAHNRVDISGFVARHGTSALKLKRGVVLLKPASGFYAWFGELQGTPLIPDHDFVQALPPALRTLCDTLQVKDPLTVSARELIVDSLGEPNVPPVIYWDGGVGLQNATLRLGLDVNDVSGQFWCRARHNGRQLEGLLGNVLLGQASICKQPLRDLVCHVEIAPEAPEVVRLPSVQGHIFGGDIGGEARIELGSTLHYELNLTATQIKLEEFGRHNLGASASEFSGQAKARLHLRGTGSDVSGLEGHGSVDVPSGKLYDLPLLLDLLKVLGLRPLDRTAFEEAHASFSIKGPRVTVSQLDLYGNAISLSGQGELNLDGSDVQLDFYAVWGRIMQVLPTMLRPLPPAVAQQLLKIKMRGKVENVICTKEPVPGLVEPLERLLKRKESPSDGRAGGVSPQLAAPQQGGIAPRSPVVSGP
jgi:hypothetical protein